MIKKWEAGVADEAWKVMVCANEYESVKRAIDTLVYTLTEAGLSTDNRLATIEKMSGAEIVRGMKQRQQSCLQSIANALPRETDNDT